MRSRRALLGLFGIITLGLGTPTPAPAMTADSFRCISAVAKEARYYLTMRLRLLRKCRDASLRVPGGCTAPDPRLLARYDERLADHLGDRCTDASLAELGFPGPCPDSTPGDGFTVDDLVACLATSHADAADVMTSILYDGDLTSPVRYADRNCQRAVGKVGASFAQEVLGAVQKCRLGLMLDPFHILSPSRCAVDDPETVKAIARAERKVDRVVDGRCSDAQATRLFLCEPDQPTVDGAIACLTERLRALIDDPDPNSPPDLIDYEFATRPPASCGDDVVNGPGEECDGSNDAACPGACGSPDGPFPCLCETVPRQRVLEHASTDFDLGWSGTGHDQHVPEGSGYVTDLFDCDGPAGPDTVCTVGPSCSLPPHSSCSPGPTEFVTGDSICATLGEGTCRKTVAGATGPHCLLDVQQRCDTDGQCPGAGDRCVKTLHGPPLPVSAGGISTCLVRVFSEDVVGTTDLATGEEAVRVRQQLVTYLGSTLDEPCPLCGGFCAGPATGTGPGARTPCTTDADCPSPPFQCITDSVCSYGPNVDAVCRPNPPSGGQTLAFGTTSVDCPPPVGTDLGTVDVLENPRSTATSTWQPSEPCTAPGMSGNACVDGPNAGRPCVTAGDCPGGTCRPQCFCAAQWRPNSCGAACVGGGSDAAPCMDDTDCPDGFCHVGDCRLDPSDTDSCQEGRCTVGSTVGRCSLSPYAPCSDDAGCAPPACPGCTPGETCVFALPQCFVSGVIERCGTPGIPDRTTAALGCVPSLRAPAVDAVYGTPGPAALTYPETTVVVGF